MIGKQKERSFVSLDRKGTKGRKGARKGAEKQGGTFCLLCIGIIFISNVSSSYSYGPFDLLVLKGLILNGCIEIFLCIMFFRVDTLCDIFTEIEYQI